MNWLSRWKARLGWIVLVLVLVGSSSTGVYLWQSNNVKKVNEAAFLRAQFVTQFGAQVTIKGVTKPKDFYIFYWEDKEPEPKVHATMYVDGLFVELASQLVVK